MIPSSLSATSILVSEACMMRWKAENFLRTPRMTNEPAGVGSSVHFALEKHVQAVYLDGITGWDDVKYLNNMYVLGYMETFGTTDTDTDHFADGAAIVASWYDRNKTGLENKVLSVESKENFPIKTSAGEIPFNFIWDRCDQKEEGVYEVVDYKTIRARINPADLKLKIQPRAYGLAAQIKWPDAKRIWVSFDMLRHGETVGVSFTREDNINTWKYLKRAAERIIATDEDDTPATVNEECKWCILKATCPELGRMRAVGTVASMDVQEIVERKWELDQQMLAMKYAQDELDAALCKEAEARDEYEFGVGEYTVKLTSRPTRKPNSHAIIRIVGEELAMQYGNMTVTNVEKMIKQEKLPPDMVAKIRAEMPTSWSEPRAKVTRPTNFEE